MLTIWAPEGVPEVVEGADLASLLLDVTDLSDGDIVVVTSKVVSKSEGRVVAGAREDWLESETVRVVARRGPTSIVRTTHGLTLAAAGIDASNVESGQVVLLPSDPDASARHLREAISVQGGCNVGVIVSDTAGRAWRIGQTDIAIGAAGVAVSVSFEGAVDAYGNPLAVTQPAVADELAGAAELAGDKLSGRPFVVIRGRADLVLQPDDHGAGAAALVRPETEDMFSLGAREAVVAAAVGDPDAQALFGAPSSSEELQDALARVPDATPEVRAAIAFAHGWTADQG